MLFGLDNVNLTSHILTDCQKQKEQMQVVLCLSFTYVYNYLEKVYY